MPTKQKKRQTWDSYEDYIKSSEWKKIRDKVHDRDGKCGFCGLSDLDEGVNSLHCHHFRYPKDWNDDSVDNVFVACNVCHENHHEIVNPENHSYKSKEECVLDHLRKLIPLSYERGHIESINFVNSDVIRCLSSLVLSFRLGMQTVVYPNRLHLIDNNIIPERYFNAVLNKVRESIDAKE